MKNIILSNINKEVLNELLEVEKENKKLMLEYFGDTFITFDDEQGIIYVALYKMLAERKQDNEELKIMIEKRKTETTEE